MGEYRERFNTPYQQFLIAFGGDPSCRCLPLPDLTSYLRGESNRSS